jgi:hypothetical protein
MEWYFAPAIEWASMPGCQWRTKSSLLPLALAALALGRGLPGVLAAQALAGFLALAIAHLLYRQMTMGPLRYSPKLLAKS